MQIFDETGQKLLHFYNAEKGWSGRLRLAMTIRQTAPSSTP
jgi:hypothetical protein